MPLSLRDDIALACKGDDYGTVGNEALIPTARGRAYGVETMLRWQIPERFNFVSSLTVFRSEYNSIASAWDNRFILNVRLKGASGQAVQNMNIMFGLPQKTGLQLKSSAF